MARENAAAAVRALPLAKGAARILAPMVHEVFACEAATRAGDPEAGIHDMRVATKRLREAVRLFRPAFRKKDYRKHLAWIEDLNDALGDVRDLDVLLPRLEKRAGRLGAPAGIDALRARLKRRRVGARSWLLCRLDRARGRALAAKLEECLARMERGDARGPTVEAFAREAILERLAKVRRRWERVRLGASVRAFHRLRLANKQLRYAIEPFLGFLEGTVTDVYDISSKLHDALGDMHDEDVLLRIVETEMACSAAADRDGWELFAKDAAERRRGDLRKTLRIADLLAAGGWDRLETALHAEASLTSPEGAPPETAVAPSLPTPSLPASSLPTPPTRH